MKLQYPAPTLSLPLEQIPKVVASVLKKKHWHHFKSGTTKLVYVPVYLFNYTAFFEEGGVVVAENSGRMAIDAVSGNLMGGVPYVLDEMPVELSRETRHGYKAEVLSPALSKEEAKDLLALKLSALLKIPRQNIKITGGQTLFWPIWRVWVEVREGSFRLDVDGVSGMVFGAEKVPERELGWYEITQEVLSELRNPSAWVKYINALADALHVPRPLFWLILLALIAYAILSLMG